MAKILVPLFRWIVITTPGSFKKSNPREVLTAFQVLHPDVLFEENPSSAYKKAKTLSCAKYPIIVTGSFYLVAEIKKLLKKPRL